MRRVVAARFCSARDTAVMVGGPVQQFASSHVSSVVSAARVQCPGHVVVRFRLANACTVALRHGGYGARDGQHQLMTIFFRVFLILRGWKHMSVRSCRVAEIRLRAPYVIGILGA